MSMKNPMIKVRPMTAASAISMDVACKSDLRPAMKRPATNLQTARRLITTHLGTKSKLSKEQIAKEKQDLKNARGFLYIFLIVFYNTSLIYRTKKVNQTKSKGRLGRQYPIIS